MEDRVLENEVVNVENEEDESTYKAYDYFKNNHSLLIAFVSGFVAIASFATSFLVYLYYSLVLQRWNVSVEFVSDITKGKYFYVAVAGILYAAMIPYLLMYLRSNYSELIYFVPLFKMRISLVKKRVKGIEKKKNKNKGMKREIKDIKKDIKKDIRKINQEICFCVLRVVINAVIIYFLFIMIFQITIGAIKLYDWIFCGILIVFCVSFIFFIELKIFNGYDVKLLWKKVKNAKSKEEIAVLEKELGDLVAENMEKDVDNKTLRDILSDKNIRTFFVSITVAFATLLVCFVVLGYSESSARKEFWVYQDNTEQDYAVIYHDENIVILEKATIEGSSISINLNEQMFIKPDGNKFKEMKFDKVIRIEK